MPTAGDPSLSGLALPLSHDPLQRLGYTTQKPFLDPAAIQAAENAAITVWLQVLKDNTGIDLTGWWAQTEAQQTSNQAFSDAIKTAIDNYAGWDTFWAQFSAAWNTWIAVSLQSAPSFDLNGFLHSMFGIDPTSGLTNQNQIAGLTDQFNQIGAALSGDTTSSGDWTWLADIMVNWFGISTLAHTTSVNNANVLKIVDNRPLVYGLDSTTEAGGIAFTAADTPLTMTPGIELIAFVRCGQTDTKNTAAFTAERAGSTTPTGLFVNIYKVDFANSKLSYITTTTFATAVLGLTSEAFLFADMMGTPVVPGDVIGVGFQSPDPTNTMNIYGGALAKPVHPVAQLPAFAATRSGAGLSHPTADIPLSDLTFSNAAIPYIGLETSAPPPPTYPDFTTSITTPGTTMFMPDPWALHLDLIGVGAGGSGEGELGTATGYGGTGGTWQATTLTVGVDIEPGTPITVSVAPQNLYPGGGPGGTTPYFTHGLDGAATTFTWTKPDTTTGTLTCAGGFGGNHTLGLSHNTLSFGLGPGDETYNGETYVGGAEQITNLPGNFPGGGGFGAQPFEYGTPGAAGVAVIVERQT